MIEIKCVLNAGALLGESPVWSAKEQALYWADLLAPAIHRLDPASGATRTWPMPETVGSFGLREGGGAVVALRSGFYTLDFDSGKPSFLAAPEVILPGTRFNDGKVSPDGRFFAGTMDEASLSRPLGALYRLDPDGSLHKVLDGLIVSNGLGWSLDGRTLFHSDSRAQVINAYDYDPKTGQIANPRLLARPSAEIGRPDGGAVDREGWDSLTVDMQHGVVDYQAAVNMLTAISTTPTVPLVRVPWLDPGIIMKVLDAGAYGVICPMVNSREDAERLVATTRYPPRGSRSFSPIRALLYAGPDYAKHADDTVVAFAMIETRQALDNLDDILSVEGLDAIYVGPADLSLALGCTPKFDQEEKPVVEAIDYILARTKAHGIVAGIHNGTPEYALRMVEKGFQFVTVGSDARLIAAGAQQILDKMRAGALRPGTGAAAY